MKKDIQEYYENYFDLFNHPGWKQLVEQFSVSKAQAENIRTVKDPRDLDFRQGQLDVIDILLSYPQAVRQTYDAIEADENAL